MICADLETCTDEERLRLAQTLAGRQARLLRQAVDSVAQRLPAPAQVILLSGSAEFLARRALACEPSCSVPVISLTETLGSAVSATACAHALAVLASESNHDD
jgi:uncharacterized hydantoinase/oxoprolinase family protein